MTIRQLIDTVHEILSKIGHSGHHLDARTVRFYIYEEIIQKPSKIGRDNCYDAGHAKALLAVKLMQEQGSTIPDLAQVAKTVPIMDRLSPGIAKLVDDMVSSLDGAGEGEDAMRTKPVKKVMFPRGQQKRLPRPQQNPIVGWDGKEEVLSASITNHVEFAFMQPHVLLGSAFAFVDGANGELATTIHRLLYGQKSGGGRVERAILYVDEKGLTLPGVKLSGRSVQGDGIRAILPDKGVYEEGGVASIFVFDPSSAGKAIVLVVSLDGATLDRHDIRLDENGCSLVRVPTLVAGRYEAIIDGTTAKCSFEATRYELSPFVVHVSNMERRGETLALTLEAETYGSSYEGVATATVGSRSTECRFHEGLGRVSFELGLDDSELSIRLVDKENCALVAAAPLPGTKKSERSDTTISSMGHVVSVSMVKTSDSVLERGLFFETGATTNTPITIDGCVADRIRLRLSEAVEDLVVVVRDPISGKAIVREVGKKKAGSVVSVGFDFPFALVHVGAFVKGSAWEGTSVVAKPSKKKAIVSISNGGRLAPGSVASIDIETDGVASVLLKVCDRRVRAHYEPMTAIASSAKAWLAWAIGERQTGTVRGLLRYVPQPVADMLMTGHMARGGRGILRLQGSWENDPRYSFGSRGGMMGSPDINYMVDPAPNSATFYSSESDIVSCSNTSHLDGLEEKTIGNIVLPDYAHPEPVAYFAHSMPGGTAKTQAIPAARGESVDLVYCDLLRVDGKRTVQVRMPDAIGLYDVKAFFVVDGDWAEAETAIRVEKETYIEPAIPRVAAEGTKCGAVLVGAQVGSTWVIKVNGQVLPTHDNKVVDDKVVLAWDALPGSHEVILRAPNGDVVDRIVRSVERPGEELVLAQEMRILKKGQSYSVIEDEAISVAVLPGMESELTLAVKVVTDFQYACCEQTSAKIASAMLAVLAGDDSSKAKGYEGLVRGEARLRQMYVPGQGFLYYPGGSMNEWASKAAAGRISHLCKVAKDAKMPEDARRATKALEDMASNALRAHGGSEGADGAMAQAYYDNKQVTEAEASVALDSLGKGGYWSSKSDAAFAVACLARQGRLEMAIDGANKVAKAMQGAMGGGWHGTCEAMAYMFMVCELQKAGVVPGANGSVMLDGKKATIAEAVKAQDVEVVKATSGAVAIRITRLQRIDLGEANSNVAISVDLACEDGTRAIKAGKRAKLQVKLTGDYRQGDVLCVVLPDCLSRIVGGAKAKKFQVDFSGRKEVEVDVVAHGKTSAPQMFAAAVRNMYDSDRLGSVGLVGVSVQ